MRVLQFVLLVSIAGTLSAAETGKENEPHKLRQDENNIYKPFQFPDEDPAHPFFTAAQPELTAQYLEGRRNNYGPEHWRRVAQDSLKEAIDRQNLNTNVAKNVIIFIGDGMGITTTTVARIHEGNSRGMHGEEHYLSFEKFPYSAFSKTYNSDWQTGDSAGGATAILCGIKAPFSTVGVDDGVLQYYCPSQPGHEVPSITYWAQDEGKATGVVTNTAITHATPASAYANSVGRAYEADNVIPPGWEEYCPDIARQLIEKGHKINVALGGGRSNFFGQETEDPAQPGSYGDRRDGRDLIEEWRQDKVNKGATHATAFNREELMSVNPQSTDYLFGLFSRGHMSYEVSRNPVTQPSLAEMTGKAIEVLQNNDNGFFLMVEGGRIDTAHHASRAHSAIVETKMFARAVEKAVNMTSEEDTLIIVTADHSHVMAFGGYNFKGTDPLDKGIYNADDLRPYTKVTYANGPGYAQDEDGRGNLFGYDTTEDVNYQQQSSAPMGSETHGGEDVGIYARGPMAHLFQGVKEQHYIPHAAGYAACMGENKGHCQSKGAENPQPARASSPVPATLSASLALLGVINALFNLRM